MHRITTFWEGESLSPLARLTLKSYLDYGYPVDLYSFGPVDGVPEGVVLRDASSVAPCRKDWGGGDIRIYSDYWRFCFLSDHGGTWIDADCPVVRNLDILGDTPFFARETEQWGNGLFGGMIHSPQPGHPAMVGLKKYYEDPDVGSGNIKERRNRIPWYAFCREFYRFADRGDQSGEPGRFTPLRNPSAIDGQTLSTEARYDGSVRLNDFSRSYTLHLVGCYFPYWKKQDIRNESLIGDLIFKHFGVMDVKDFLFG